MLPERDVVLEERRSRVDNRPSSRLSEQMNAAFYVSHPYGKPVIGWQHEIKALNRDKAMAFYKKYYAPNNAIVIVSGDITMKELKPMVERTYGKLKSKNLPTRCCYKKIQQKLLFSDRQQDFYKVLLLGHRLIFLPKP